MDRFRHQIQYEDDGHHPSNNNHPQSSQYQEAFDDRPFLQNGQDGLMVQDNYLSIDSSDRQIRNARSTPSNFRVKMEGSSTDQGTTGFEYENVYSVQLQSITVPNTNGVLDEPYLLIEIEELSSFNVMHGTNQWLGKAFSKLYFLPGTNSFVRNSLEYGGPSEYVFRQAPLASLNTLTLRIRKPDGTIFDFGADTLAPTPPNRAVQTSMVFKIGTLVPDTCRIPRRNS